MISPPLVAEASVDLDALLEMLERLPDGVLFEDATRRVALSNSALSELLPSLGSREELAGEPSESVHARLSRALVGQEHFLDRADELYRTRATTRAEALGARDGRRLERDGFPLVVDGVHRGHVWLYRLAGEAVAGDGADFLARFSHELRNPLTGVLGAAQLLANTETSDEQREALDAILTSGKLVLQLVEDVMDYEKLRTGRFVLSPRVVDLWALLEEAAEALQHGAGAKGLGFSYAIDPSLPRWVRVDPLRLRQLLMNLGSNALKFTEQGAIRVSALRRSASAGKAVLELSVEDTGPGIESSELPRMFEAFVQGRHAVRGTGLGLAISRDLAEAMGGALTAKSERGVGSAFSARVQIEAARPASASRLSLQLRNVTLGAPARKARLLVAEDDAFTQVILRKTLERLGHSVELVGNGAEALEACAASTFDAILMDCQMPLLDGYRAAARLRELGGWTAGVPIIALTANALTGDRETTLAAGMSDYLAKPFTLADLAGVLDRWLPSMPSRPAPALLRSIPPVGHSEPPGLAVNPERLAALAQGDDAFLDDLCRVFLDGARERLDELRTSLGSDDDGARRNLAHALAGAAANVGAQRMAALARELEADPSRTAAEGKLPSLRRELARIETQLRRELDAAAPV